MGLDWQKPGINHTGEYLTSGHTYVLARDDSTRTISLNYIPSEVTIITEANGLEVEFEDSTSTPVTRSTHLLKGSHTFRIKCKKIKFVGNNSIYHSAVIACTNIPAGDYTPPVYDNLGQDTV